ncbi:MAG: ABC transporter ATP-binding protein [Acholeplasmatales bacterium]|nr:ABC transporter ATP-binding protein [Acholeplasmatales bacterium]
MISIKNLTKVYKSKGKDKSVALNDISFDLPSTGLVFVLGKSGSGKSTLLNIIGGLDSLTSGQIIANGNDISNFNQKEYNSFRSSYVGFVFQDYHLLDELTVFENISFFLSDKSLESKISDTLKEVGLEGYENRYPNELSGGQQQRVSIARAIIKKPHILLCDEPTGNLDKKTTTQILDFLHELSKTTLVVIVSHNENDALKYGDRIIELSEGKIIRDESRLEGYDNNLAIKDNELILPHNYNFNNDELEFIYSNIKSGNVLNLKQNNNGFISKEPKNEEEVFYKIPKTKIANKNIFKLFKSFLFSKKASSIVTIFLSTVMIVLFSIIQSFLEFDSNIAMKEHLLENNNTVMAFQKRIDQTNYMSAVDDKDIALLDEVEYSGNIYKLYNYNFRTTPTGTSKINDEFLNHSALLLDKGKIKETFGTLQCNLEFLNILFSQNEVTVLAGDIEEAKNTAGLIITDYIADVLIMLNPTKYEDYNDILGSYNTNAGYSWGTISAIIKTDYKDKHNEVVDRLFNNEVTDEDFLKIQKSSSYVSFMEDILLKYGISYTLNPNFLKAIKEDSNRSFTRFNNVSFSYDNKIIAAPSFTAYFNQTSKSLDKYECKLEATAYTSLFGEPKYDEEGKFIPVTVSMYRHRNNDINDEILYSYDLTIVGVTNKYHQFNREFLIEFTDYGVIPYAIYLDDLSKVDSIVDITTKEGFLPLSADTSSIYTINKGVRVFNDLFNMFQYILLSLCAVFFISYGIRNIKDNKYQIGVIKALGGGSLDISKIFVLKTIIIGLIICIISTIGIILFTDLANDLLINSIMSINNVRINSIRIISIRPNLIFIDLGLVLLATTISALIPLLVLHRIKPLSIIKAKE